MTGEVLFEDDDSLSEGNIREWLPPDANEQYFSGGAAVTPNYAGDEVTVDAGVGHQLDSGGLYTFKPPQKTLTLPAPAGDNWIYGVWDPATDDSAEWVITDTKGSPADPKLLKAKVDASAQREVVPNERNQTRVVSDLNSPYTTTGEDLIICDTANGAVTVTLATSDLTKDGSITVINADGSNAVTVDTESTETIDPDGDSSKSISETGWPVSFTPDGSNWDSSLAGQFDDFTATAGTINELTDGASNVIDNFAGTNLSVDANNDLNAAATGSTQADTGTVTASGGSTPALDTVLTNVGLSQDSDYWFLLYVDADPGFNADYAFNFDHGHQWDDSTSEVDINLTVNWDTDPGSTNDVTLRWEVRQP